MWAVKDSEELASQAKGILGTGHINCARGRRSQWRTENEGRPGVAATEYTW